MMIPEWGPDRDEEDGVASLSPHQIIDFVHSHSVL